MAWKKEERSAPESGAVSPVPRGARSAGRKQRDSGSSREICWPDTGRVAASGRVQTAAPRLLRAGAEGHNLLSISLFRMRS